MLGNRRLLTSYEISSRLLTSGLGVFLILPLISLGMLALPQQAAARAFKADFIDSSGQALQEKSPLYVSEARLTEPIYGSRYRSPGKHGLEITPDSLHMMHGAEEQAMNNLQVELAQPSGAAGSSTLPIVPVAPLKTAPINNLPIPVAPAAKASTLPSFKSQGKGQKRIVINTASRQLWLYEGKNVVKVYSVGVGRPQFQTPLGRFEVITKVLDPAWENPYLASGQVRIQPGMENPLGTRWIGFKRDARGEYGLHGTDDPPSVGKYSSHGCVRMFVKDAEDIFNRVSFGTPVEVIYQPVVLKQNQQQLTITVYPDSLHKGMPSMAAVQAMIQKQFPGAAVSMAQLKQALSLPTQRAIAVGKLPTATNTIATSGAQPVNSEQSLKKEEPGLEADSSNSNPPLPTIDMFSN